MRARGEEGFVMVTVILVLAVAVLVGGVVISDSVAGRATTRDDLRGKRAQQAAEAAIQDSLYRLNQSTLASVNFNGGINSLSTGLACALDKVGVSVTAEGTVNLETSCPAGGAPPAVPVPGTEAAVEPIGNRQAYQRYVRQRPSSSRAGGLGQAKTQFALVGVGRDTNGTEAPGDDVVRRVLALTNVLDPLRVVEATGDARLNGAAMVINGNVRANEDIDQSSLAVTSGNILGGGGLLNTSDLEHGKDPGDSWEHCLLCVSLPTVPQRQQTEFSRDPISIAPSKPSCATSAGTTAGICPSSTYYSGTTHRLTVPTGATLTLTSGDYVFCSVDVQGTLLTAQTGGAVRIFVDSPSSARCNPSSGTGNIAIRRLNPGVGLSPDRLQIYAVGNGTEGGTSATLGSTSTTSALTTNFVFYGPQTNVTAYVTTFQGAIVGHDVTMQGVLPVGLSAAVITQDLALYDAPLAPGVGVFSVDQYVQCRPAAVTHLTALRNC